MTFSAPREVGLAFAAMAFAATAYAGEVGGEFSGCDVSGGPSLTCKWVPGMWCSKPRDPVISAYDVDSFNRSVDEFNGYVADVQAYLACVTSDAKGDVSSNFPKFVGASVDEIAEEMSKKVRNARSLLERSRALIGQ